MKRVTEPEVTVGPSAEDHQFSLPPDCFPV